MLYTYISEVNEFALFDNAEIAVDGFVSLAHPHRRLAG